MKNKDKSKLMLSILVDFVFIVTLISVICGAAFFVKLLLYPEPLHQDEIRIRTETTMAEYKDALRVGDVVFDTLTKRRVGEIKSVSIAHKGEEIYFILTLDASFIPRSKALRTKDFWFYFAPEDV